jgi:hypothetical protein
MEIVGCTLLAIADEPLAETEKGRAANISVSKKAAVAAPFFLASRLDVVGEIDTAYFAPSHTNLGHFIG